jgi:hypothetical protein
LVKLSRRYRFVQISYVTVKQCLRVNRPPSGFVMVMLRTVVGAVLETETFSRAFFEVRTAARLTVTFLPLKLSFAPVSIPRPTRVMVPGLPRFSEDGLTAAIVGLGAFGVTGFDGAEAVLSPWVLVATTVNVYA